MVRVHGADVGACGCLAPLWTCIRERQYIATLKKVTPMRIDHYFITTDLIDTVSAMDIGDETQGPDHHAIFLEPGLGKSGTY